jgi:hypothetical protein
MLKQISKDQALFCMRHGEFGDDVLSSAEKVAVLLSQSWCPQWHDMKRFVRDLDGCSIFYLEYDLADFFDRFRALKEEVFNNFQIPYIRYYTNGKLIDESNAVSEKEFCEKLGLPFDGKGQGRTLDFLPSA